MVKITGSNQGASSAYTDAGPPEIIIALRSFKKKGKKNIVRWLKKKKKKTLGRQVMEKKFVPVTLFSDNKGRSL